jgi:sterol desaturase/sphingolipid hydroxylase (fatty acid hydroxylase superfamily)/CDGSH-type Zn-finger protein
MDDRYEILVIVIIAFFGLLETFAGFLSHSKRKKSDWIQEVGSFLILSTIIKPAIAGLVMLAGNYWFPKWYHLFSGTPMWVLFLAYLLVDDFLQYWYHRSAHEHSFFWKLHRPHHQAEEMGFFVSYRNAALYYLLMPNIWWIGLFTFLAGGEAVVWGLIAKQVVIISSHSTVKWDVPFYKNKFLQPIIKVLERIIITPAFHHAHHGQSKKDGISDPNANFGNMFSIWDQIFGTAVFTGKFPKNYGLPNNTIDHWTAAYLYPIITSSDTNSEIHAKFSKNNTAFNEPVQVHLQKGEKYLWCQCGLSKNQPFCDGTHHGTQHKPVLFEVKKDGNYKLCNCKISKAGPFCDNSHLSL